MEFEQHKEDWRNMVAHDLRSPLTNIYATCKILEDLPRGSPLGECEASSSGTVCAPAAGCSKMLTLYLDIVKLDAELCMWS